MIFNFEGFIAAWSPKLSIIVAGGRDSSSGVTSSVEILDEGSSTWRPGPDLPEGVYGASMVEDPRGSVIIIGGFDGERKPGSPFMFRTTRAQVA